MSYLIDTGLVISFLNGRPTAVELFDRIAPDNVHISAISVGEVLEGFHRRDGIDQQRSEQFTSFIAEIRVIPVDQGIAERFAGERAQLRSAGMLIPDNDLWIAATALFYDLTLVSGDQHFNRIDHLKLRTP